MTSASRRPLAASSASSQTLALPNTISSESVSNSSHFALHHYFLFLHSHFDSRFAIIGLHAVARGSKTPSRNVTVDPIVLCVSDDEAKCSPDKPREKPLEVVDDDDDDDEDAGGSVRDDQGTCANSCSTEVTIQDSADKVIPGFAGAVDCDIDLKVIALVHLHFIENHSCSSPFCCESLMFIYFLLRIIDVYGDR